MIKITGLTKSFGNHVLFDDISFNLNPGERAGLVGRNGHGKTTLLRIIIGEEHQDDGDIAIPKNYSIGYVRQKLRFTQKTIIEEACIGLPEERREEKWQAEKILFGLGFSAFDMDTDPSLLSGGYQVRLNLAKILVSQPNLLLLDEPTNYLDVVAIRWLSRFLREWKNELILITHDRSFMDSVITDTIGIHRKKAKKVRGTTDKLYNQILKEEEIHEKTRINDEKKRKEAELFITRFRAKARLAGMVQSRIKALEKKEKLDKLEWIKTLVFAFSYEPSPARVLMNVSGITFGYDKDAAPLLNDLSFSIGKHDRICVIGRNGKGKTTLLKILAGQISPDSGEITLHPGTRIGYFAQTNTADLNENLTIEQELMNTGCARQQARDICGAMMFEGDMALKKIGVISGGEKSRVLLGKILASPSNLLLLDEPTNHLDMESCDAFIAAIDSFEGATVIVTHNEMFLHTLATRFIIFQKDTAFLYEGSYQSFLEKVGWEEDDTSSDKKEIFDKINGSHRPVNKKDMRRIKADIQSRKARELNPVRERISQIEKTIAALEEKLHLIQKDIISASSAGNGDAIAGLSIENFNTRKDLDALYNELEEQTNIYEQRAEEFDIEMKTLDITS